MAEADNQARIQASLARARGRWLVSAMINAGGRWAVLPAGLVALVGIALALAGVRSLFVLLPLVALGLVGAVAALLITRRAYARPAAAGAPDWSLLLDRSLGLDDALPAYVEGRSGFNDVLAVRIVGALDPLKEKAAAPRRHFAPLFVALILALFPLVSWLPDPLGDNAEASEVAQQPDNPAAEQNPGGGGSAQVPGTGEEGEQEGPGGEQESRGGGGDEGEVQKRPDGSKTEGGAGEAPKDAQPQPLKDNPNPNAGGTGDSPTPPTDAPKPEDTELDNDLTKVRPTAGDGETRTEDRSRWVYNPDGEKLDGATPRPPEGGKGAERAMSRTELTTSERKLIESIYRKLFE